jgi:TatD DNase family protein
MVVPNDQLDVFHEVLEHCSRSGGKILTIHSRRAASEVLKCLRAYPSAGIPILHWFTGSHKELRDAIDFGCWFSIGPAMLSSAKSREQIAMMPHDRVLTESDGPSRNMKGIPCILGTPTVLSMASPVYGANRQAK